MKIYKLYNKDLFIGLLIYNNKNWEFARNKFADYKYIPIQLLGGGIVNANNFVEGRINERLVYLYDIKDPVDETGLIDMNDFIWVECKYIKSFNSHPRYFETNIKYTEQMIDRIKSDIMKSYKEKIYRERLFGEGTSKPKMLKNTYINYEEYNNEKLSRSLDNFKFISVDYNKKKKLNKIIKSKGLKLTKSISEKNLIKIYEESKKVSKKVDEIEERICSDKDKNILSDKDKNILDDIIYKCSEIIFNKIN